MRSSRVDDSKGEYSVIGEISVGGMMSRRCDIAPPPVKYSSRSTFGNFLPPTSTFVPPVAQPHTVMSFSSSTSSYSTDPGDSFITSDSSCDDLDSIRTPFADHNDGAFIVDNSTSSPSGLEYLGKARRNYAQHNMSGENIHPCSGSDSEAITDFCNPGISFSNHTGFDSEDFLALASPSAVSRSLASINLNSSMEGDPFSASFLSDLDNKERSLSSLKYNSFEKVDIDTSQNFFEKAQIISSDTSSTLYAEKNSYFLLTLGRAYSSRFPSGHHLEADFVRSYTLNAELGCGGYGFVMVAHDIYNNREVAVKFIFKEKIPDHAWAVDDFQKPVPLEAKILSFVSHDGIVKFYDLFEDSLYFYLVSG